MYCVYGYLGQSIKMPDASFVIVGSAFPNEFAFDGRLTRNWIKFCRGREELGRDLDLMEALSR